MKRLIKLAVLTAFTLIVAIGLITACGGNATRSPIAQAQNFFFSWKPVHLLGRTSGSQIASVSGPFVANAQTTGSGGGNLSGFCADVAASGARAATVIFGLGRWSSGVCSDAQTPDTQVGVTIPQNGQLGNLTVDAIGHGTGADSGQMELKVIHQDGTQTILPITCTMGISNAGTKTHCEDKASAHFSTVAAGDQFAARIFYNGGDSYTAIRVNIQYAVPNF